MQRAEAKSFLAKHMCAELSASEREAILNTPDEIDLEARGLASVEPEMLAWLHDHPAPVAPEKAAEYLEQLFQHYYFYGVTNDYLQQLLSSYGCDESVEGAQEILDGCYCCGYATIHSRGNYEVCPVCVWEDDGMPYTDRHSGPNHMTLAEGRENYKRMGRASDNWGEPDAGVTDIFPFVGFETPSAP